MSAALRGLGSRFWGLVAYGCELGIGISVNPFNLCMSMLSFRVRIGGGDRALSKTLRRVKMICSKSARQRGHRSVMLMNVLRWRANSQLL